jgi:hypothetical protein
VHFEIFQTRDDIAFTAAFHIVSRGHARHAALSDGNSARNAISQ